MDISAMDNVPIRLIIELEVPLNGVLGCFAISSYMAW